jgi:hypothetical protein
MRKFKRQVTPWQLIAYVKNSRSNTNRQIKVNYQNTKNNMKQTIALTSMAALIFFAFYIASCSDSENKAVAKNESSAEPANDDILKQGEHLVTTMGCNDCHSPKRMGANGPEIIEELMFSGFPSDRPVAKFDTKLIKSGFSIFYPISPQLPAPGDCRLPLTSRQTARGLEIGRKNSLKQPLPKGNTRGWKITGCYCPQCRGLTLPGYQITK